MTEQEKKVLQLTRELWNEFIKLPVQHDSDQKEFAQAMHIIQNMIVARLGYRELNKSE